MPIPRLIPYPSARSLLVACVLLSVTLAAPRGARSEPVPAHTSKPCLECHAEQATALAATPHRLPAGGADGPGARIACTDCHAGDSRHWEDDPQKFAMSRPSGLGAVAEARLCSSCHPSAHQDGMAERNVHVTNDVNCSACHSVHGAKRPALLKAAQTELCFGCHRGVEGQFAKPYRHPVNDHVLQCSDCHTNLGPTGRTLARGGSEICTKCHAELEGPFPFEHPATVGYSTEEGGCMTCHDPHGSYTPRMLKQPYEPPHFQLCTQCHSVPRHNLNSVHGTRWSGVPCSDCHTDIHGSYVSRLYLSESLRSQGCFNVGCHQF